MKSLFVTLLLLFAIQSCFSQESNKEMLQNAETELNKAVEEQDFEKAAQLKREIDLRKEIEIAIENSDFELASSLKEQLESPEQKESKIASEEEVDNNYAFPKPSEGKALVEFVRVTYNGWNAEVRLFDDKQYLGSCWGVSHMRLEFDPGEHFFWVYWDTREDFLEANLEANKVYVVYIDMDGTGVWTTPGLTPITAQEVDRVERAKRVIFKHPVKVTSEEDIIKIQAKLERKGVIDKMFKQYEKKYKGTDKTLKLEEDMNIPWERMQPK